MALYRRPPEPTAMWPLSALAYRTATPGTTGVCDLPPPPPDFGSCETDMPEHGARLKQEVTA